MRKSQQKKDQYIRYILAKKSLQGKNAVLMILGNLLHIISNRNGGSEPLFHLQNLGKSINKTAYKGLYMLNALGFEAKIWKKPNG